MNSAIGGTDNYTIFDSIIPFINTIKQNDIIIIGWSHTLRFRVVNINGTFTTIRPRSLNAEFEQNKNSSKLELSNTTLTELSINRDNGIYIDELNNYIKLLNFTFSNNKIIHWSPFRLDRFGLLTTANSLQNLETVLEETKGVVDDAHFSENAHKLLAEQFLTSIKNYKIGDYKKPIL
jgi:hypothetical protein